MWLIYLENANDKIHQNCICSDISYDLTTAFRMHMWVNAKPFNVLGEIGHSVLKAYILSCVCFRFNFANVPENDNV